MTFLKIATRPAAALALGALAFLGASFLGSATARAAEVDYVGFAWETGGLAASLPGDQLSIATVVTQIDPLFEVDLDVREATLYIDGLVSQGAVMDPSSGATTITYGGGSIALHASAMRNHAWGLNPANGTVPSTFVDGDLVFSGVFTGFVVTLLPSGVGIFEGYIDGTGGSALAGPCANCAYTFAGTFTAPTGAQVPEGYDLQVDGGLVVESAVAVENVNWGSLKALFNSGR
ncbi:MAG: hypothetical protein IPO18_00605 [bacterium]|nr:hypothetical protein [bacterium]MBK9470774.1 hypothetical protein [bacterium]